MFERFARTAIAAAVLGVSAAMGPRSLAAQSIREYERRVDALAADARNASLAVAEYRKIVDERSQLRDTVRAGSLQVITAPEIEPLVGTAAARAFAILQSRVGSATRLLSGHVFFARPDRRMMPKGELWILAGERDAQGAGRSESWHDPDADNLTQTLADLGLRAIVGSMNPAFRTWAPSTLPTDSMSSVAWSMLRVAMVSSPATIVRRCYAGDIAACRVTLGLAEAADPVVDWYDARDRQRLVRQLQERDQPPSAEVSASCLGGNDESCIAILRRTQNLPTPFGAVTRASLVRQAVAIGGPGAMERMVLAGGSGPGDALAAAAGVPVDAVLAAWQRNVHDTRVPSDNISARTALMAAAWILVFGALALRSPRWR